MKKAPRVNYYSEGKNSCVTTSYSLTAHTASLFKYAQIPNGRLNGSVVILYHDNGCDSRIPLEMSSSDLGPSHPTKTAELRSLFSVKLKDVFQNRTPAPLITRQLSVGFLCSYFFLSQPVSSFM